MALFVRTFCTLSLFGVLTSLKEMTVEEKRVENALFAMVGEEPPYEVPLNHKDQTLHDMLVTSVRAVQDSHVGRLPNDTDGEPTMPTPCPQHQPSKNMSEQRVHDGDRAMNIWFHLGFNEVVLFDLWNIKDLTGLLISCGILFLLGGLYEVLKWYRVYFALHKKWKRKESFHLPTVVTVTDGRALKEDFKEPSANASLINNSKRCAPVADRPSPFSLIRAAQAFFYILQLTLAYLLMMVVMTYNVWLALAVILGAGFGYWIVISFCADNASGGTAGSTAADGCH